MRILRRLLLSAVLLAFGAATKGEIIEDPGDGGGGGSNLLPDVSNFRQDFCETTNQVLKLRWDPVPGAAYYRLRNYSGSSPHNIDVSGTSYQTSAPPFDYHSYAIAAVESNGTEGSWSGVRTFWYLETAPYQPGFYVTDNASGPVGLNWDGTSARDDACFYTLHRRDRPGMGEWVVVGSNIPPHTAGSYNETEPGVHEYRMSGTNGMGTTSFVYDLGSIASALSVANVTYQTPLAIVYSGRIMGGTAPYNWVWERRICPEGVCGEWQVRSSGTAPYGVDHGDLFRSNSGIWPTDAELRFTVTDAVNATASFSLQSSTRAFLRDDGLAAHSPVLQSPAANSLAARVRPGDDRVELQLSLSSPNKVTLSLVDVAGRTVEVGPEWSIPSGVHDLHWDLGDHQHGIYWVTVRGSGVFLSKRVWLAR